MSQLISRTNSHIFISGQTRSGKTYFAAKALKGLPDPVLFINIQDEQLPGFQRIMVDQVEYSQLEEVLKHGEKIDLRFPANYPLKVINKITGYILDQLMTAGFSQNRPIYVAVDECHTLEGAGLDSAIQVATRGLARGVRGVFITQRPALVSKTLYTQATEHYMFYLSPAEKQYFKEKGFDFEQCQKFWTKNGQYSYVYFDGKDLNGRRAV